MPDALIPNPTVLRRAGPPAEQPAGVQIDDPRLAEVLDPQATLKVLYDQLLHSEGPVWQATPSGGHLAFSDIPGRRVLAWAPDGQVTVLIDAVPFVNGNSIDAEGRLVHCEHLRRCISRSEEPDGFPVPIVTHYQGRRLNTPNDVTVAADGAIWFTDPVFGLLFPRQGCLASPELDHRSLYRFDPLTRELRRAADFDQPNGLAFSPDGLLLYVSDTSRSIGGPTHEVVVFDVRAGGELANRRFFCQTEHGVPDGFLVDARGWLWCTAGDGLHVYDADARRLGFIPTPKTASNVALGGLDGRRLFITAETCLLAIDMLEPGP